MADSDAAVIASALSLRVGAIRYHLGRTLRSLRPEAFVLSVYDQLDPLQLEAEGFCELESLSPVHCDVGVSWERRGQLTESLRAGWYRVGWDGERLELVYATWRDGFDLERAIWVVAEDEVIARRFVAAALDATHIPHDSVLVFARSCFSNDKALFAASVAAEWTELILEGDLASRVRREVRSFLGARALYERYGVPYKRGILLTGPPGNGKTHCVRLLIKEAALPTVYVRSFAARYGEEEENIARVFRRARRLAPCMLVLEDLDALVRPQCLSVFLNELDGLRADTGILTVATTNHPERLDPALLERPSRFDRKYRFDLPGPDERRRYLEMWNAKLEPAMTFDDVAIDEITQQSHGMSFAFLKELIVSAMVRWMAAPDGQSMSRLIEAELGTLRGTWRKIDDGDAPPIDDKKPPRS